MSRTLPSILSILAIAAAGVPLWLYVVDRPSTPPPAPPRELGPTPITTELLGRRDVEQEVEVFGTLAAARTAQLAPEHTGPVVWVAASWRPGARVRAGEPLLRLDAEILELELESARALEDEAASDLAAAEREIALAAELAKSAAESLEIARRETERLDSLLALGRIAESQVDLARASRVRAEAELDSARARVETAAVREAAATARGARARVAAELVRARLERTELRAPFDGYLTTRPPALGTFLQAGVPLVECLDLSEVHLLAMVHEDDLARIAEGFEAIVELPSQPGRSHAGRVRAIGPSADMVTRSAPVEIAIPLASDDEAGDSVSASELRAGLFARARIDAGTESAVLWVDRRHIVWDETEPCAFVLAGDVAERRVLELGDALGEGFAVLSGLEDGERLVTGPLDRITDGTLVRELADAEVSGAAR